MKLDAPPAVLEITRQLERAGHQAWAVGGAVRDALLGHLHLDWDLATDATPDQVRTIFGRKRTIPVGVEFGTVGVLDSAGILHEVTTFRRDVRTDGRHAEVEFGASLDEDLARRDFTINAIAFSPSHGELYDPFAGRADLEKRVIRAVGDPGARMREDRLRALRAMRFAARFGFEIERATWDAIKESAPHLTRLSAERVKQELEKTMDQVAAPSHAWRLWRESGACAVLLPELARAPEGSAAAMRATDCAAQPGSLVRPGRRLERLAVLLSDLEPESAFRLSTRLRFAKRDAQWMADLVANWRELGAVIRGALVTGGEPAPATVRRWVAGVGRTRLPAFFRLLAARYAAERTEAADGGAGRRGLVPAARAVQSLYRRSLRVAAQDPIDLGSLAIDGDDLRAAGIAPGPGLGKILSKLLDVVLEDPGMNTRERLLAVVRRLEDDSSKQGTDR